MSSGRLRQAALRWSLGRFVALLLFTGAVTALGMLQVWDQHRVVTRGYRLDSERFEHRRLTEQAKRLDLSLATLEDPVTVERFAEQELGMRAPTPRDELHVPGDREVALSPVAGEDPEAAAVAAAPGPSDGPGAPAAAAPPADGGTP